MHCCFDSTFRNITLLACITERRSGILRKVLQAFLILITMKTFYIKSPSGKILPIYAETIYHAIQKAMVVDGFSYNQTEYNKLNPAKK